MPVLCQSFPGTEGFGRRGVGCVLEAGDDVGDSVLFGVHDHRSIGLNGVQEVQIGPS
jgi:hypothetical protein